MNDVQASCAEIKRCFEDGIKNCKLDALLGAITSLRNALSGLAAQPGDQVALLAAEAWQASVYPSLEACCFSDRYHALIRQADTSSDGSKYASVQSAIRDLLKDALLPLVATAAKSAASAQSLALHLRFALHMAATAAEVIGYRDPRVSACPSLRNYGLVNVLWIGIVKLWSAVPIVLRPQLEAQNLGAVQLVRNLETYMQKDLDMICERREAANVKLLQFWAVNMAKIVAAFPETAAPAAWEALWRWGPIARGKVAALEAEGTAQATAVAAAVTSGELWARVGKVQAQSLGLMAPAVEQAVHAAAAELQDASTRPGTAAAAMLDAALKLLEHGGTMPPHARAACVPLLKTALAVVPCAACSPAVSTSEQCRSVANAFLTFMLSLAAAPGGVPEVQSAWEECQVALLEVSMRPHPALLSVLSTMWASLASLADASTLKHFATALHELLASVAAVEAAGTCFLPLSPTATQLTHLLAAMLKAAPQKVAEGFFGRFLHISPQECADRSAVAPLGAVLRAAALTRRPGCCSPALAPVRQLCMSIEGARSDPLLLAWTMDATAAGLECLGVAAAPQEGCIPSEQAGEVASSAAKQAAAALLAVGPGGVVAVHAPPMLRVLTLSWHLNPSSLPPSLLDRLLPCLESLAKAPATAAGVAGLLRAYRDRPAPPKALFETLLSPVSSPAVQLLGREAYVAYAQECGEENVLAALPRSWVDSATGALSDAARPTMERYLQRGPARPGAAAAGPSAEAQAAALERLASAVPCHLVELAKEAAKETQAQAQAYNTDTFLINVVEEEDSAAVRGVGAPHQLEAAVGDLVGAVERVERALGPCNGQAFPAAAQVAVRQCRDALTALLPA